MLVCTNSKVTTLETKCHEKSIQMLLIGILRAKYNVKINFRVRMNVSLNYINTHKIITCNSFYTSTF